MNKPLSLAKSAAVASWPALKAVRGELVRRRTLARQPQPEGVTAPPQMVAQIRKMMEGQGGNLTYCLSKADTEKGFEEMFRKGAQGDCKYERFDASAHTIDASMVCNAGEGGSARMTMNGTVSATGSQVTVNVEQKNDKSPMGNADIAMELDTRRIGDCPAGGAKSPAPG